MKCLGVIAAIALVLIGCGGSGSPYSPDVPTDSPPIVSRVDPASGPAGTVVTVYGLGFSYAAPINIISVGGAATWATDYQLLANPTSTEIEALTATIPADAAVGQSPITVTVYDNTSNADIMFDVTP